MLPSVAQFWVKPAAASGLMPLHQNHWTDSALPLQHPPLRFPLYNSPSSKGKFPEASVPLFIIFSRRHLPVVSNKQGFLFRLQTGEPFFHQPQRVAYSGKEVAVWQLRQVSPSVCPLNKSAKMDMSTSMWKADTLQMEPTEETATFSASLSGHTKRTCQLDCAKHLYPHPENRKSLQGCARLRTGTPLQLYLQLFSALKTFLSGSSEMKQKAGLAPESASWALERKLAIRCKPQGTTFQEGKVPETTSREKACGKNESQSFPTKIGLIRVSVSIHSLVPLKY